MTTWTRINRELQTQKQDWGWLAKAIGVNKNAMNHWEKRGVPAKWFKDIAVALKKPPGWLSEDEDAPVIIKADVAPKQDFTSETFAALGEQIQRLHILERVIVLNQIGEIVTRRLNGEKVILQIVGPGQAANQGTPSETPPGEPQNERSASKSQIGQDAPPQPPE